MSNQEGEVAIYRDKKDDTEDEMILSRVNDEGIVDIYSQKKNYFNGSNVILF